MEKVTNVFEFVGAILVWSAIIMVIIATITQAMKG